MEMAQLTHDCSMSPMQLLKRLTNSDGVTSSSTAAMICTAALSLPVMLQGVARQRNSSVCSQSVPHSPLRGKAGTSTSMTLSAAAGPGGPVATQRGITIQDALAPAVDSTTTSNASAHTQPQQQLQHGAPSLQESTKVPAVRIASSSHCACGIQFNNTPWLNCNGGNGMGLVEPIYYKFQP